MNTTSGWLLVLAFSPSLVGCTWETDLPSEARSIHVEPSRELVVSDESVVAGPLAKNQTDAPLSFRHALSRLPLEPGAPLRWLEAWSRRLADEGRPERARTFDEKVTCRWLKATARNQCDESCATCVARELDLTRAPFRLRAVVNRTDLSVLPDRAADGGEGRLVFALTNGPADDPASEALPASVILEYAQEGAARGWAERWHALAQAPEADFPRRLADLTETFVARGAVAQIRTADAFTGPMVLHQFEIEAGEIGPTNVRNTPDWARVPSTSIRTYAEEQSRALDEGTAVMPKSWWAKSSSPADPPPAYVAELAQRDLLVGGTCAGCHARSTTGFHIDPVGTGDKRLSRFLVDVTKSRDELRRRVEWMQLAL